MERTVRRKFYPMAYYLKERDLGSGSRRFETQIHKTRDGLALAELSPLLYEGGYDYGATILNVPKRYLEKHNEEGVLLDTGHSLQRSDMILLVTRPPLNEKEDDHRAIFRGDNSIEEAVFKVLQGFLINCDRTEIIIHPNVDLGDREELRAVHFRVNQGGTAQYLDKQHMMIVPDDPQFTVGYLL